MSGLLLAGLLAGCQSDQPQDSEPPPATPAVQPVPDDLPALVAQVEPSVVTVLVGEGLGSGVVVRDGGLVVTNEHVVRGAQEVELALAGGERVPAEVVGADAYTDVAVLQAERTDLPPARFRAELPPVGEPVLAVGSPLGFRNTVTFGIVSGVGREIPGAARESPALVDLIQTDAAISPGNSGGALVDLSGQVVGINEAYLPPETGAVSIGFAIPTATVLDVVDDLLDDGRATHSFVGIVPGQVTPQIAAALGLPVDRGVFVREVGPQTPAAAAGLRPGDIITAFNGEPTDTVEEFLGALRGTEPGQSVTVNYLRGDQEAEATVTVAGIER
ncbi:MAG TPA: trypsin-like peptidase domain-containing protein [Natronosporangium sp.]